MPNRNASANSSIRVTTVIPVYNGEATIRETLDSALAQEFDGQEIIVVNDGSTDSTPQILSSYGDRIKVVSQPNRGPALARNIGARSGTGEYVAFLDGDDLWVPHKLTRCVEALDRNPAAVLAFSAFSRIGASGETLTPSHLDTAASGRHLSLDDLLNVRAGVLPSSLVIRRTIFETFGGFCEDLRAFEDWYFSLRAREHGEFFCLRDALVQYRTIGDDVAAASKYVRFFPDAETFVRLVRRRYGRRKSLLRRDFLRPFASAFVIVGLQHLDAGRRVDALRCFATALRCWPAYPLRVLGTEKLLSWRQARRFFRFMHLNGHYR